VRIYRVGGSVRDELLGLPVSDHDYVVVGADPAEMQRQGFKPVGADFPVFLHPETHAEYALARTERKTGPGYKGFAFHAAPDVTLEQDLQRRDLTINAMARDEHGALVDPHGGSRDLEARVLRHVGDAFAEDPVRILRVARFAARFTDFTVAAETQALMARMVAAGEADALVPERVWQEISRGLMEARPDRMVAVLDACGALGRILPELHATPEVSERLRCAAAAGHPLPVRFALLVLDVAEDDLAKLVARMNAPGDVREIARTAVRERAVLASPLPDADATLTLLERADAFRRPERLDRLLEVIECDAGCPPPLRSGARPYLVEALKCARAVDAGRISREEPDDVPGAIRRARLMAVAQLQPPTGH
jgi:tRNA nucleotidyltransferase (CCA-adding enzyme)